MLASHLDDGEFARLIYDKIGGLIGSVFEASLKRAIDAGDAKPVGREPMNLFWFAHHTLLMVTVTRLPTIPCLAYGEGADFQRQLCEFILRGIGLNEAAIIHYLDRDLARNAGQPAIAEAHHYEHCDRKPYRGAADRR
jgi:hypothetical protein